MQKPQSAYQFLIIEGLPCCKDRWNSGISFGGCHRLKQTAYKNNGGNITTTSDHMSLPLWNLNHVTIVIHVYI